MMTIRDASVLELWEEPRLETSLPKWPPEAQGANHQGVRLCAISPRSVRQRGKTIAKLEIELMLLWLLKMMKKICRCCYYATATAEGCVVAAATAVADADTYAGDDDEEAGNDAGDDDADV